MWEQVSEFSSNLEVSHFFLLAILVGLEAVLSADNAIALASISQSLPDSQTQQKALNIGLLIAFILRMSMIVTATWVIKFWQFELLGALYLLWLVYNYFSSRGDNESGEVKVEKHVSLWQVIPMIALTDLAFSLDSITTAIAISEETWLILTGATLGIIALRFLAQLFITWLDEYVHLEMAGYLTVGLVGLRLLVRVIDHDLVPPEWLMILTIAVMFTWGFSQKVPVESESEAEN